MKKRGKRLRPGYGMVCAIASLLLALTLVPITAGTASASSPDQLFELNKELTDDMGWRFTFIQLSDLHIGDGFKDYGSQGYDDAPAGDEGTSAQNLRQAVEWINANSYYYGVRFVVVTGDLTDSAEKSEFLKSREILDLLRIPYVPVLGNHDTWPHCLNDDGSLKEIINEPTGDAYFKEIFGPRLDTLRDSGIFGRWDDGTRNTAIWNGEADKVSGGEGCWSHFQNFSFDFAGYHFIATDFNTRNRAWNGAGAMGYADLYDWPGGTWYWYKNHLNSYPYKAAENVINFSHQPLCEDLGGLGLFTFDSDEYKTVTDFINDNYYRYHTGLWAGGHFHENTPVWSPSFEYDITTSGGDYVCPGVHTEAVKDGPSCFRMFKVWAKTSASNPSGVILYENENFGGRGELFVWQNFELAQSFLGDNVASSLRIMGSGTVELFADSGFGGARLETDSDRSALASSGFDNVASSVKFDAPVVTGITPGRGTAGTSVAAVISGARFKSGAYVKLKPKSGKEINGGSVQVTGQGSVGCSFNLKDAAPGFCDLVVTNSDGLAGTLASCFEITKATPQDNGPEGQKTFYFAEGFTGSCFQEYLSIGNPNDKDVPAEIIFMFNGGGTQKKSVSVPAHSRATVNVNELVGKDKEVSALVRSETAGLVAERPMYFNYQGRWTGGHDAVGATSPGKKWYFAEGTTREGFEEWFCVQNPGEKTADLTFRYMVEGQGEKVCSEKVNPHSRSTFSAGKQAGAGKNISLLLESSEAVVAERSMYFSYQGLAAHGWTGGHCVVGAPSPAKEWYFAEGTTRQGFEEWLCLQNPNSKPITVRARYLLGPGQGGPYEGSYTVPARERLTLSVNRIMGSDKDVSVKLTCDSDFIAERPLYFNYRGLGMRNWDGGHNVIGARAPAKTWFLAEGYTGSGFEEWLCVQNPGEKAANLTITYYPESGSPIVKPWTVPANARLTVSVNRDAGANLALSTKVTSDERVIVERPIYFSFNGAWTGGHDVIGFVPSNP